MEPQSFTDPTVNRNQDQTHPARPVRLFQIVENLDDRAVESWLFRVFRQATVAYPDFDWTFFCVLPKPGEFDDAVRAAGGKVIHSQCEIGNKISFMTSLRRVMRQGHYDVLHTHHDIMSAVYLAASAGLPFRKRIVHLHNTSMSLPTPNRVKTDLVREPMRQVCLRMADQIVGISTEALESLIGKRKPEVGRYSVVHYAVDTARFREARVNPNGFRESLGFASTAKILLFVGRLVKYKNPRLVLEILEQMSRADSEVVAVFAGIGDQQTEIRNIVNEKSLQNRVRLLGFRRDVPELMLSSDVLIWPSVEVPKEGLGLGIIEAQAAGLPILMSLSVPTEAIVVPELIDALPLSAGPKVWASTALSILNRPRPSRSQSLAQVEASSFSLTKGVANLMRLYENVLN